MHPRVFKAPLSVATKSYKKLLKPSFTVIVSNKVTLIEFSLHKFSLGRKDVHYSISASGDE